MSRGSRALARCAISAVAVACPLIAAAAAQAAIAGANPPTQTIAPDLRSVSLIATNEAVFCFDKTLANGSFTASNFELAGYNSATFRGATTAALDVGNTACVVATYTLTAGSQSSELKDYSIGTVLAGAVTGNAGGTNLGDSVPETSSTSHSGTAGVTTSPNLVSLTVDASLQQIDYVFDRPVDPGSLNPANFFFYTAAGLGSVQFGATATVVNGNQVDVGGFGADVRTAVVAAVGFGGGNDNASGAPATAAPIASLPVPGTSGTTVSPVVLSAAINSPNTIDFTFSSGVGTIANVGEFVAYTSNGSNVTATGAVVTGANTVRATFDPTVQSFYEEFVRAGVGDDGVSGSNGNGNIFGGVAVGGNVGAFATGFTNAPDARSLKLDNASGTATVDFDQRINNTAPAGMGSGGLDATKFVLHAADGSVLAAASGTPSVTQGSSPSDSFVALQYTPQELSQAAFLEIQAGAVSTFSGSGFNPAPSVAQIIAASAPASAFRPVGSHVHSVVRVSGKKHGGGIFAAKPHKAAKKHKSHKKHKKH